MKDFINILKLIILNNSIIRNIVITFFIANLLIIVALGVILIRDSSNVLTTDAERYNYQIVEQVTIGLNNMLNEIKEPLYVLSRNSSVIDVMKNYHDLSNSDKLNYERQIEELSFSISRYKPIIRDILILGENGYKRNLRSGKPLNWEYDFTNQSWYIQAVSSNTAKIINLGLHKEDYYFNPYGETATTLSIAIPVLDYHRNTVGAIVCNLELNRIQELFSLNPYDYGELKLVSNEGQILVGTNQELIGESFPVNLGNDLMNGETFSIQTMLNGKESIIISSPATIDDWHIVHSIALNEITKSTSVLKRSHTIIVMIFLLINFSLVIILAVWIYRPIQNLLSDLTTNNTSNLKGKNYKFIELNKINVKYMDLLERVNDLTRKNYQAKIALKESELRALYSQINPHVLFNTLQLLQTEIVFGNKKESNQIILSLSNLLRYSMNQRDPLIEISKEIEYIKGYLFIINKKFIDKIELNIDIPDEILNEKIVKLTIQPIVENSIKHGLQEGAGVITISGTYNESGIKLTITDNGVGISDEKISQINQLIAKESTIETDHIGLHNVNLRLKHQFGDEYGIGITSKVNEYTKVTINLPKANEEDVSA